MISLVGCENTPPPQMFDLKDLPEKTISYAHEWRTARRVIGQGQRIVTVGPTVENGFLRIGALPPLGVEEPSRVRVEVGGETVEAFEMGPEQVWQDRVIPLGNRSGDCTIEIDSPNIAWLAPCEIVEAQPKSRPNVLFYMIDALRQDHVGCYGYNRDTTPHLDAFAKDAVRFTEPVPQCSWTRPSVSSFFTSAYPEVHRVHEQTDVFPAELPTLQGTLQDVGYETHIYMTNPQCLPRWGFDVGLSRYKDLRSDYIDEKDDAKLVDAVIDALDFLGARPWYIYAHSMAVHIPYTIQEPRFVERMKPLYTRVVLEDMPSRYDGLSKQRRNTIEAYDSATAYADAEFGRLIGTLKERGLYNDTMIVVASDHGQEFWEHGIHGHGRLLVFEGVLRIPLLIKLPGNTHAGETVASIVEGVDIAPTILDALGLSQPDTFQGQSLVPHMNGDTSRALEAGYARLRKLMIAKTPTQKYVYDIDSGEERWFDLEADPKELHPLDAPPPGLDHLAERVAEQLVVGEPGLNVLLTRGDEWPPNLSVELTGDGITGARVRGGHLGASVEIGEGRTRIALSETTNEHWGFTRICFDVQPDADLALAIEPDIEVVAVGPTRNVKPDRNRLRPIDLLAAPNALKLDVLANGMKAHIWFVPQGDALEIESLDDVTRDALEALGYLGVE